MTRKERYAGVLGWFSENMPVADSELDYQSAYQLLVATILAAQCTDRRVNMVTPAIFERWPSAHELAQATPEEMFEHIRSVSYPNAKSRHLVAAAQRLVSDFGGDVPSSIDELQTLAGVGRKTANVVAAFAFGEDVMPVDTHVFRVAARLGLTRNAKTPLETERQLVKNIPAGMRARSHHWLLLHGRYVCTARKPKCTDCGLREWCVYSMINGQ